ncbi:MAG: hypothetical protein K6G61_03670 [Solobacterium sp.]|nr:hypothetical protein [Solobacterium sp.]
MKKILGICLLMTMLAGCACQHKPDASGAHAPVTLETAAGYLKDGEYGKAIETYSALIREDSSNAIYYLGRAQAYAASGTDTENLQSAEADYRKVLEIDNTMTDAYVGLADVYLKMEDYESATGVLVEGITVFTDGTGEKVIEDLQKLEDKLENLISDEGRPADENTEALTGKKPAEAGETKNLSISGLTSEFHGEDTGGNEGAVGMMQLNFMIDGPSDVAAVRIASFGEELYDAESIAYDTARIWKEGESHLPPDKIMPVPTKCGGAFPVEEKDLGTTMLVLLVGTDADFNVIGYTVAAVPVTR